MRKRSVTPVDGALNLSSFTMEPRILAKHYLASALRHSGLLKLLHARHAYTWRVLCYHRTIDPEALPYGLQPGMFVRPRNFAWQMELIARRFKAISLEALCELLREGRPVPANTIVITFDDGWLDNYEHAFPVLKRLGVPATIFLPTAFIGTERMFWTDEVALAVREAKRAPNALGEIKRLDPEALAGGGSEELVAAARSMASISEVDHLVEYLKRATPTVRQATLQVLALVRQSGAAAASTRVFVNWEEVEQMRAAGISFGSHSHEHHNLTELDAATLDADIAASYRTLRAHGLAQDHEAPFCFPGGYYNERCLEALDRAGVRYCTTTTRESVLSGRPMLIGRTLIHDDISATAPLFLARLAGRPF